MATKLTRNVQHDLTKVIKLLSTGMPKYVKMLEKLAESRDETIAMKAVMALMDYYKDSVDARDKAEMAKLVIQLKLGGGGNVRPPDNTPMIDFSTIREAE